MKRFWMGALGVLFFVPMVSAQTLGTTEFPNSGNAAAQEPFLRGLLLLHSFEYVDAAEAFREAQSADPDFAMAYWGEAMTHNHPLWFRQDRTEARNILNRLADTARGRQAKAPTPREKAYLQALEVLYGDGEKHARDFAYRDAMCGVMDTFSDDLDAASFCALAILGTSHDGRDFSIYMQAAALVEDVFAQNPDHPGATHYLIHSYDDPVHAPLGLRAARRYAVIAPAAAHALHMPSHVFLALGMWDETVYSNIDSFNAGEARVARKGLDHNAREYHALYWLAYGLLQQGRWDEARTKLDRMTKDTEELSSRRTRSHLVRMKTHFIIETEQWTDPAVALDVQSDDLGSSAHMGHLLAQGMAAIGTGDLAQAESILADMKTYRSTRQNHSAAEIMEQELEALILFAQGDTEQALALMEKAATREAEVPFGFGPPTPPKPSHELYGELLLAADRAEEAMEQFEQALARAPNRSRSLLGLARAATAHGDLEKAAQTYARLRAIWDEADGYLPALAEVQTAAVPTAGGRE